MVDSSFAQTRSSRRQEQGKSSRMNAPPPTRLPESEESQPRQTAFITLNDPVSKSGFVDLPQVSCIIISINHMAEESNEEGLNDGHGINKVFLDLSI